MPRCVPLMLMLCYALSGCGRTQSGSYQRTLEGTCPMTLELDFQGVWTNPNAHSKVPSGAALRAENIVNPRPGVAECVPGQQNLAATYEESDERFSSGTTYQGLLIESTSGATPRLYRRDGASLTPYATEVSPPDDVVRMPFAEAGSKLYMATAGGVQVVDGVTAEPVRAGAPRALYMEANGNAPMGTLLATGESVAYRYILSRPNAAGVYERGVPSGRIVYVATGNSDVVLNLRLPAGLTATDRIEVYRTGISPTAGVDPGDMMFMVSQSLVNTSDYSLYGINFLTDTTPDSLRGEPLYTNANSEGILRQNERPPLAGALLAFDDALMLGNVTGPQQLTIRLLGLPSAGDVLTIDGVDYEAGAPPLGFLIGSGGTVSENIEATARSLVTSINLFVGLSPPREIVAAYASGQNDPPGIVTLEAIDITKSAFAAVADANGGRYEPSLVSAVSSSATTEPNGIWVSKRGQHYAFPPLRSTSATYRFRVGVKGGDILAMAAIKDAVIVFVDKEGVFKVKRTGAESWRVDQINANANLLVPGSVVVVDNQVLALTTRGLVAVDEGGVEEIDLPIKDKMDAIKKLNPELLRLYSFAVGDEARLRYIFYHPISGQTGETPGAYHAWVYNADNGTWTERTDGASGGMVGTEDGRLYLGTADAPTLSQERTGEPEDVFKGPGDSAIPFRLTWTVKDEGDPGAEKQFTELRLLTKDAFTGDVTFNCTNDLGGSESTTGSTGAEGEPFVRVWVPDGCQRTSRLTVDIQRNVLGEAFEVVGMKSLIAGMYDGGLRR